MAQSKKITLCKNNAILEYGIKVFKPGQKYAVVKFKKPITAGSYFAVIDAVGWKMGHRLYWVQLLKTTQISSNGFKIFRSPHGHREKLAWTAYRTVKDTAEEEFERIKGEDL